MEASTAALSSGIDVETPPLCNLGIALVLAVGIGRWKGVLSIATSLNLGLS
jgi:hypothetical protein